MNSNSGMDIRNPYHSRNALESALGVFIVIVTAIVGFPFLGADGSIPFIPIMMVRFHLANRGLVRA